MTGNIIAGEGQEIVYFILEKPKPKPLDFLMSGFFWRIKQKLSADNPKNLIFLQTQQVVFRHVRLVFNG